MPDDKKTLTVIGSGPAGMMAAITAAENGMNVTVIEQNEKLCRKIYATGNGRCNFTNMSWKGDVIRSGDAKKALKIIKWFTAEYILERIYLNAASPTIYLPKTFPGIVYSLRGSYHISHRTLPRS